MASRIHITTILTAFLVTGALALGSQPAGADPAMPDSVLTAGLRALAGEYGDSLGHITTTNARGTRVILAQDQDGFGVYTAGDPVALDDTLAFCEQGPSGALSSCEIVAPNDPTAYDCDWDDSDSWCDCYDFYDCMDMFKNGPCTEGGGLSCNGSGCNCEA